MSSVQSFPGAVAPGASPSGEIHAAIARAAQATGVDFGYLLAQAKLESGLDPAARAPTSSASGLYQFTGATWLRTLDRHGASYGVGGSAVHDPAARSQIMALRSDPQLSALMAGELANDNRAALTGTLGRAPDNAELYLAHFLGSDGAGRFLTALGADPSQSAAALLPKAAAANRSIFFGAAGPRSVGEVMDLLRGRLDTAMNSAQDPAAFVQMAYQPVPLSLPGAEAPTVPGGPIAQEFHAAASPPASSMADTLRDAFGLAGGGAVPDHVRAAYGRLRAFGM